MTTMQTTLKSVSSPKWADAGHTMIDCTIVIANPLAGERELPFTASLSDPMPHGVRIFNDIVNGCYGEIAEFIEPGL